MLIVAKEDEVEAKPFMRLIEGTESLRSLLLDVVDPAGQLTVKAITSTSDYVISMLQDGGGRIKRPVEIKHLHAYRLVDIDTKKTLRPDSPITFVYRNFIGEFLIQLESG